MIVAVEPVRRPLYARQHSRTALSTIASKTGWTSVGELADHAQDLARRRLLLERLGHLRVRCVSASFFLQLGQQARVLDRDHRLVGEGLEERDLVVREPAGLAAGHRDRPDRLVVTEQRHYHQLR